ncbi:alpha/beta fold hydrolase [Robbsia andropogonis]|uniref:alpha/beta fold hydrolase n=1 Tax=Robbsia andropogonis TaxID=28092 RepID=UPI003D1A454A
MTERTERGGSLPWILGGVALTAVALAGTTLWNKRQASRAERRAPAQGRFVDIAGVRLHYLEKGQGPVVLLLHGTGLQATDFVASGLFDVLARRHRVIAIDRPGFGYSGVSPDGGPVLHGLRIADDEYGEAGLLADPFTPAEQAHPDMPVSPMAQAATIRNFLDFMEIDEAVVVGHSFGATVAAALALTSPESVKGLVLLGGYFYPGMHLEALASLQQLPLVGRLIGQAVAPLAVRLLARRAAKRMFAPHSVTPSFEALVPRGMRARPSQVSAAAREKALMLPGVFKLRKRYWEILQPTTIFVGDADAVVDPGAQSLRLHRDIPHSDLRILPRVGHMSHYAAARKIAAAVAQHSGQPASAYGAFGGDVNALLQPADQRGE